MTMKNEQNKSRITSLMALLIFGVFAVCILMVLLTGADVYSRLVDRGQQHYDCRTVAQYVTTRVRQADRAGSVTVADFGGVNALVLREEIHGEGYLTRVYCFDGFIRELFTAEGGDFSPEDGEKLLEAKQLSFSLEDSTLSARITLSDENTRELTLHLRSAEEVQP